MDLEKGWEFEEIRAKTKGGDGQQTIPVEDSWISNIILEGTEVMTMSKISFTLDFIYLGCPSVPSQG